MTTPDKIYTQKLGFANMTTPELLLLHKDDNMGE